MKKQKFELRIAVGGDDEKVKMEIATTAIRERDTVKELVKKANELLISFMRAVNARSTNKRTE